ncbi:cAMP phosphodiesterases class-II domain containing protein [Hyaloscypha variabilis]
MQGSGGGPVENNTTAFLVRSTSVGWRRGCLLAVDAGVHLAAIAKILEGHKADESGSGDKHATTLVDGPFEGLQIPHSTANANAAHITRTLVDTYLITHPHLDHISGFVVNTAALPGSRPKRLAGLPSTIEAFKNHIFNNVIWPNLSDENNGAGLVTYMRLVEGGSPALGDGDGKGYVEVCEGLSVKTWGVSHGHCIERHSHRGSNVGLGPSIPQLDASPRQRTTSVSQSQLQPPSRTSSGVSFIPTEIMRVDSQDHICVYDSSAYFIRDVATGKEILMFGDVEPDAISLSPRNKHVWSEAAPRIVSGHLGGVFIECSYDDSQSDDTLFGHIAPRFMIEEMKCLANEVRKCRESRKKRKREGNGGTPGSSRRKPTTWPVGDLNPQVSPRTGRTRRSFDIEITQADGQKEILEEEEAEDTMDHDNPLPIRVSSDLPLKGLKIVIIHMKDKLCDGTTIGDVILEQLQEYEAQAQLGCQFVISKVGEAMYF